MKKALSAEHREHISAALRGKRPPRGTPEERFWAKVEKTDGCWLWRGATWSDGYGVLWLRRNEAGKSIFVGAHRFSYEMHNGQIPEGLDVCHMCDNPSCVNPAHLFVGTVSDNLLDAKAKGRLVHHRGEAHHNAAFTAVEVQTIRARYAAGGVSQQKIADEYGVHQTVISDIVRYRSYAFQST